MAAVGLKCFGAYVCDGLHWLWSRSQPLTAVIFLGFGTIHLHRYVSRRNRRMEWAKAGKDMVVLHCLPRGRITPHLSPFVMKLETYLRLAKIPYKLDFTEPFGPKGKSPWITFNGEEIGDSQLVMEHLGRQYKKDFSSKLTEEQKAVARAFYILMDEHLCWGLRCWRFQIDNCKQLLKNMPSASFFQRLKMKLFMRRTYRIACWAQGIGRHSEQEVNDIVWKDLAAVSHFLGKKPFLMGEDLCEVDCTVFAFLSQIMWCYDGSPFVTMLIGFPNLPAYVLRVKERLWPDWDQCLAKPKKS